MSAARTGAGAGDAAGTVAAPSAGEWEAMRRAALEAMERAYAPYSGFRVGAALLTGDGTIVSGANVENASYGAVICAERSALAAAVSGGARAFRGIVVATEAEAPSPPCGICRQALVEFGPRLPVRSVTRGGREARWSMAELLPEPFTPEALGRQP